ncbi:Alpha/beta hydrolase fold-3 domain-containing protein (Fragment) [Madurella fahalii]|uniref:Alpha/beta hydrolase fold-3 domain-containing protein n=1 Tax=Madurella fahalii TaxID=1157608 RepID=A0ABQ0G478_9PEZI
MSTLPSSIEDLLCTGIMNPEFEAAWKARGSPPGDMPTDVLTLKKIVDKSLPGLQQQLAASRPANIIETEHVVPLSTGFASRLLVCHAFQDSRNRADSKKPCPIVLLFHGGGHVLGFPEFDLKLARQLALNHNAIVICPSTRKAPEDSFPAMIDDAWAFLKSVAREAASAGTMRSFLPAHADAAAGFIVGGASSGANFADVVAHLAREAKLSPPLTGQVLICGGFIDPDRVPEQYVARYLSREQNKDAPMVNNHFLRAFHSAIEPDVDSPLWAPFNQHHPEGIAAGHKEMPPAYFQICGMDMNRDDGLIYERVLREECGVPTRLDLYSGFPHCWWDMYPELDMSKKRMKDTLNGFEWLLGQPVSGSQYE